MVRASRWTALSATVRGASHEHNGQANQDAIRLNHPSASEDVLIMAIADGHGSMRSFRSDRGSALAAECALRQLRRFVRRLGPNPALGRARNQARTRWPRELLAAWKKAVRADLLTRPFSEMEFAAFPEAPPVPRENEELPVSAYLAYGATLVTVAITPWYIFYSQLGDGDILTVRRDGTVARPFPRQHEFQSSETVSLCSHHAQDEFQVRVDGLRGPAPALVMVSTDGYANCFDDDEGFFQVGADFLTYLRTEGAAFVLEKIEEWLQQSSRDGSGDDITVGLAVRDHALHSPELHRRRA